MQRAHEKFYSSLKDVSLNLKKKKVFLGIILSSKCVIQHCYVKTAFHAVELLTVR